MLDWTLLVIFLIFRVQFRFIIAWGRRFIIWDCTAVRLTSCGMRESGFFPRMEIRLMWVLCWVVDWLVDWSIVHLSYLLWCGRSIDWLVNWLRDLVFDSDQIHSDVVLTSHNDALLLFRLTGLTFPPGNRAGFGRTGLGIFPFIGVCVRNVTRYPRTYFRI